MGAGVGDAVVPNGCGQGDAGRHVARPAEVRDDAGGVGEVASSSLALDSALAISRRCHRRRDPSIRDPFEAPAGAARLEFHNARW